MWAWTESIWVGGQGERVVHRGALPKPSHAGVQRRRGSGGGSDLSDTRHVLSFRDCHHFDNGVGSLLHLHFSPRMNSSLRYDIGQILLEHLHHLLITMVQPILHVHPSIHPSVRFYLYTLSSISPLQSILFSIHPITILLHLPAPQNPIMGWHGFFMFVATFYDLLTLLSIFYFGLCIGMVIINSMES